MKSLATKHWASCLLLLCAGCSAGANEELGSGGDELESNGEALAYRPRPTTIKLGVLDDPTTTTLYGQAARLAAAQMNLALELAHSDVRFELVFGDDQKNTPAVARSEALRLVNTEKVLAMVSDSSGDTTQVNRLNYDPALPIVTPIPVVCYQCSSGTINSPTATDADPITQAALRDANNYLFRIFYNANFEAKVLDQILVSKANQGDRNGDGVLRISIFADAGHTSLAGALGPTLASYTSTPSSVEIIQLSNIANVAAEWPRVVDSLNESTGVTDSVPDYVILAMLPVNVAPAVQAYSTGGFSVPVLSNNSFRRNYVLAGLGSIANGLEGSSVALANDNVAGKLFVNAFKYANAGQGPEQTSSGAYDATTTLMLASLVAAKAQGGGAAVTSAGIREGLTKINRRHGLKIVPSILSFAAASAAIKSGVAIDYEGAYSNNDWDAVGDIFPPLVHWTVTNSAFVESESYQCDPDHLLCPAQ